MAWVEKWWKDTAKKKKKKGLIWKADWGALRRSIEREGGVEKLMKRCHVLAVKAGHGLMIMLKVKVSIVRNYLHRSVLNLNTFRRYKRSSIFQKSDYYVALSSVQASDKIYTRMWEKNNILKSIQFNFHLSPSAGWSNWKRLGTDFPSFREISPRHRLPRLIEEGYQQQPISSTIISPKRTSNGIEVSSKRHQWIHPSFRLIL